MSNLILRIITPAQKVKHLSLARPMALPVEPGASYVVLDKMTLQPPSDIVLKRQGDTLIIEAGHRKLAHINKFYASGTQASFLTEGAPISAPAPEQAYTPPPAPAPEPAAEQDSYYQQTQEQQASHIETAIEPASSDADSGWFEMPDWNLGEYGSTLLWGGAGLLAAGALAAANKNDDDDNSDGGGNALNSVTVNGTVSAGPVVSGNDLLAVIKDVNDHELQRSSINANGQFSADIGDYNGVIVVEVINNGSNPDYLDETSDTNLDLATSLFSMGVIANDASAINLNINPITTIAYQKARQEATQNGTTLSETGVKSHNSAIAQIFDLGTDLHGNTVITVNGNAGFDSSDSSVLSTGEQYGAILAAMSGLDNDDGGSMLNTLNTFIEGISVTSGSATINQSAQQALFNGADIYNHAPHLTTAQKFTLPDSFAPEFSSGTSASIDEGSGANQVIYTANATDTSGAVSYDLVSGNDSVLDIDNTSGAVTLKEDPDHETTPSYQFTITAQDSYGNKASQLVTVNVNDLSEDAVSFSSGNTINSIAENSDSSQTIYSAQASGSGTISYSLKPTADYQLLNIDNSSGVVTLADGQTFDHENQNSYNFTVIATDGDGNRAEKSLSFTIDNLDEEAPNISSGASASSINDGEGGGSVVYTASASDSATDGPSNPVTLGLKQSDDHTLFDFDSSSGTVTLKNNADYAQKSSYSFTIVATDAAGNSSEQAVTLNVNQSSGEISFSSSDTADGIVENNTASGTLYTAAASSTASTTISYSLDNSGDGALFDINDNTGVVNFKAATTPDYEQKDSYSFTVTATDGQGNSTTQSITLPVTNVDDTAPEISSTATATAIGDNSGAGQVVYSVTAEDPASDNGPSNPLSYALKNELDAEYFSIDSSSGEVSLKDNSNYSLKSSYQFTVQASDSLGNSSQQTVSLSVNNSGDSTAPGISSVVISGPDTSETEGYARLGDTLSISVNMDETSIVSGTPQLTLTIGDQTMPANYSSGSGSSELVFTSEVVAGLEDSDGISIAADSLTLSGDASIKDSNGNDATLTHTAVENNSAYKIDSTAPEATLINPAPIAQEPEGKPGNHETIIHTIALGDNGEFATIWRSINLSDGSSNIYVQQFHADGSAAHQPHEFESRHVQDYGDFEPDIITIGDNGEYLATWANIDTDPNTHFERQIIIQKFNADGSLSDMPQLPVNSFADTILGQDSQPQLINRGNGEFSLVWDGFNSEPASTQDYPARSVKVLNFNSDGSIQGEVISLDIDDAVTMNYVFSPIAKSIGSSGEFVVAWENAASTKGAVIAVQKFNADGSIGDHTQHTLAAASSSENENFAPDISAIGNDGAYAVTWEAKESTTDKSILVQKFNPDNSKASDQELQLEATGVSDRFDSEPSITQLPNDEFVVTWFGQGESTSENRSMVFVQQFAADGTTGNYQPVTLKRFSEALAETAPVIQTIGDDGEYIVAWSAQQSVGSSYDIYVQKFNSDGTTASDTPVQLIAPNNSNGLNLYPDITEIGNAGEFLISWSGVDSGGDFTVFSQKFNADGTVNSAQHNHQIVHPNEVISIQSNEVGSAYLVDASLEVSTLSDITSLTDKDNQWATTSISTADTAVEFTTAGLIPAVYTLYTADQTGNLSAAAEHSVTITGIKDVAITKADGMDNEWLGIGDSVTITVTSYNDAMVDISGGKPSIALNINNQIVQAEYLEGSESSTLTFGYTIASGLTPDQDGISLNGEGISLNGGKITDMNNHTLPLHYTAVANNADYPVDGQAPTVTIDSSATIQAGNSVTVTPSENGLLFIVDSSVNFTSINDLEGLATSQWAAYQAANQLNYNLDSTGLANGSYKVYAQDIAANISVAADDTLVIGDSLATIEQISLSSDDAQDGYLTEGESVTATLTFSENVDVSGTPQFTLDIGGNPLNADYQSGSGGTELLFSAQIPADQVDTDGIGVAINSLSVDDASIKTSADGAAVALGHDVVESNANLPVDSFAPIIEINLDTSSDNQVFIQSSESGEAYLVHNDVSVNSLADITAAADNLWNQTTVSTAFSDIAVAIDGLTDGNYKVYATDAAGNLSTPSTSSIAMDASPRVIDSIALSSATGMNGEYLLKDSVLTVTLNTSAAVAVTDTPQLSLMIGDNEVKADYSSSSDDQTLLFSYTVAADLADTDGISIPANALSFDNGSITTEGTQISTRNDAVTANSSFKLDSGTPLFTSAATADNIAENSGAGQIIYSAQVTDGSALQFSLDDSADSADFSIDSNSGEVRLTADPDYETKSSYNFTLIATDAAGNAAQQAVSLEITDITDESAPSMDTNTVVFDLVQGLSSSHSDRSFNSGTPYEIYVRVDSNSNTLKSGEETLGADWEVWTGAENLDSDDKIILVGDEFSGEVSGVTGKNSGQINSLAAIPAAASWKTSQGSYAVDITSAGNIFRVTANGKNTLQLWSGNWSNLNKSLSTLAVYAAEIPTSPNNILTTQGLA